MGEKKRATNEMNLNNFILYIKKNKLLCTVAIFVAVFAYGFSMTQYTLSIDEEIALERGNAYQWSNQGRFGLDLLKMLLNMWNTNSVTSGFLAVSLLICTGLLFSYSITRINRKSEDGIAGPAEYIIVLLFVTFPAHTENIGFSMMSFELGIGWLGIALSSLLIFQALIFEGKTVRNMLAGVLLAAFSTSLYQGFLPALAMALVAQLLLFLLGRRESSFQQPSVQWFFKIVIKMVSAVAGAFIIYKAADWGVQFFVPSSGYVENFIVWGKEPASLIMERLTEHFRLLLTGKLIHGSWVLLPTFAVTVLMILIYGWLALSQKGHRSINAFIVVTLIAYLLIPFLLHILLGAPVPIRGSFAWALLVSSLWAIVYTELNVKSLKRWLFALVIFIVFHQANAVSQIFYSDYNRYMDDVRLADQIGYRILDLNLGETPVYPVAFVGKHVQKERNGLFKQEVVGYSFFEWDGGNPLRMNHFMKAVGYDYILPTKEQEAKAARLGATMLPAWPDRGSVTLTDGLIIVNLSDEGISRALEPKLTPLRIEGPEVEIDLNPEIFDAALIHSSDGSGTFSVKAGGSDPSVVFGLPSEFNRQSYDTVEIELQSDLPGQLQMFLKPEDKDFNETLSGFVDIEAGTNIIYCDIPRKYPVVDSIRIDPPNNAEIRFKKIRLVDAK